MLLEAASSRDGTPRVKRDRSAGARADEGSASCAYLRAPYAIGTRYDSNWRTRKMRRILRYTDAWRAARRFGLVLVLGALSCSCDLDSFTEPSIAASCSSIGSQCSLPNGPLGVCQEAPCVGGATPPCFKCTAQH